MLYALLCYNSEAAVCSWSKDEAAHIRGQIDRLTADARAGCGPDASVWSRIA